MIVKAAELEPGQSVFDHEHPDRARYVHSVETGEDGGVVVSFGHPSGEPEPDPDDIGTVAADKEYVLVEDADGQRVL